jgi:glutamyl-tRNA synthetase
MNGQHLSLTPAAELEPIVSPLAVQQGFTTVQELRDKREWWLTLLDLLRVRARTTHDIVRQAATYFADKATYDEEAVTKHWNDRASAAAILEATRERLAATEWNATAMEEALRRMAEAKGVSSGKVFQPLRVALVGQLASPGIFDVLTVLGREKSLARLDAAVEFLGTKASG